MAKVIMIQGTASNAGKSLVTAALCRIFAQDGYRVAPFKSQNMALNSFITEDGKEMGRAQVVQAEAAYKKPDVRMNPILLKPSSDRTSQVVVNGEVVKTMKAMDYYKRKTEFIPDILKAFHSLAEENDIIVIEGAGSPAEINLNENDIVNMGLAKLVNAPVLLVGDIDRGGVFASLYGTYHLLGQEEQSRFKGYFINKFRGDASLLQPGIEMMKEKLPIPCMGVIPHVDAVIEDEDSLAPSLTHHQVQDMDIAVIRLPHISNFTDFHVFELVFGQKVRFIEESSQFGKPDFLILPGTKNTIGDLKWLREEGLEQQIKQYANDNNPVFGICGGYQMLCNTISDPYGVEGGGTVAGLNLLPVDTVFLENKTTTRVKGTFQAMSGIFQSLEGVGFEGYEVHMGTTSLQNQTAMTTITTIDGVTREDGCNNGNVYGSYVHGIFDDVTVTNLILEALYKKKGMSYEPSETVSMAKRKEEEMDKLARAVRNSIDLKKIYELLKEE